MISIAICDDRPEQLKLIDAACRRYFLENTGFEVEIFPFAAPMDFLDKMEQVGGYDIALLDICMPGMSGIDVAREIRARKDSSEIIFLSTSNEFGSEAFAVSAVHYLLKPFSKADFDNAMNRAMQKINEAPVKKILLNGKNGAIHRIDVNQILYIENVRNWRSVYTSAGTYDETKRSLTSLLEELEALCPRTFVSPYRGYIINFAAVNSITAEGIVLKGGTFIPIKSGTFRKLRDSYFEYAFAKKGEPGWSC